jgi:hypothetical protein
VFVIAEDSEDTDSLAELVSKVVVKVDVCNVSETESVTATSEDELPTAEESNEESTIVQIHTPTNTTGGKLKCYNVICIKCICIRMSATMQ